MWLLDSFQSRRRALDGARGALAGAGLLGAVAACNPASSTDAGIRVPVRVSVAAAAVPPGATEVSIRTVRLSIAQAALGAGDEFGCKDCNGNDDGEEAQVPQMLDVVPGAGPMLVATEQARPGRYTQAELELVPPPAAAPAGWVRGATIEIAGSFRGVPFTLPLMVDGAFRVALSVPVDVSANGTGGMASALISLPVAAWFVGPNGEALDPAIAASRAQIEANIRQSLLPAEMADAQEDGR
jgi:hypothetical protein